MELELGSSLPSPVARARALIIFLLLCPLLPSALSIIVQWMCILPVCQSVSKLLSFGVWRWRSGQLAQTSLPVLLDGHYSSTAVLFIALSPALDQHLLHNSPLGDLC